MKKIIQFQIYKSDAYYVAYAGDLPIVTQAKTLDELAQNINEAVGLALEGEDLSDFDLAPEPSVLMNFELPSEVYA